VPPKTCLCPRCQKLSVWLATLSRDAEVDYYRCFTCAAVWTVPKGKYEPITEVTVKTA
jgi:hypothetical protein